MFDPDYRKKGWRNSSFAPKNRKKGKDITQLSAAIAGFILFVLYLWPFTGHFFMTTTGLAIGLILFYVLWVVIAWYIRRLTRKKVSPVQVEVEPKAKQLQEFGEEITKEVSVSTLSYADFEHEVARLFNVLTPYKAIVMGGAGDKGIDLQLLKDGQLVGIVQCKKYDPSRMLQPGFIRELHSCKIDYNVDRAYLVTTAHFSNQSRREAERKGIILIDGDRLNEIRLKARETTRAMRTKPGD